MPPGVCLSHILLTNTFFSFPSFGIKMSFLQLWRNCFQRHGINQTGVNNINMRIPSDLLWSQRMTYMLTNASEPWFLMCVNRTDVVGYKGWANLTSMVYLTLNNTNLFKWNFGTSEVQLELYQLVWCFIHNIDIHIVNQHMWLMLPQYQENSFWPSQSECEPSQNQIVDSELHL